MQRLKLVTSGNNCHVSRIEMIYSSRYFKITQFAMQLVLDVKFVFDVMVPAANSCYSGYKGH